MFHGSILMNDTPLFGPELERPQPLSEPEPSQMGLFARFALWLLEPINFPGKWPNGAAPPKRYNEEEDWYKSHVPRDR